MALAFSDHPEEVTAPGVLFSGGLLPLKPVRFQYYHLGGIPGKCRLVLQVSNPGRSVARLLVIQARGGPATDYFQAGHENNVQFLRRLAADRGRLLQIAAGQQVQVVDCDLPRGEVVSGTVQFQLLTGGPLDFSLAARSTSSAPLGTRVPNHHATGFYPVADQVVVRGYRVGAEPLLIDVGSLRQAAFFGLTPLRGDYGVIYRMKVHLSNPSPRPADVWAYVNPRGGAATGTFLIPPGEIVETRRTKAYEAVFLRKWHLNPGQHKTIDVWTIPEGASSYPVRIIFSSKSGGKGTTTKAWNFRAEPLADDWWSL